MRASRRSSSGPLSSTAECSTSWIVGSPREPNRSSASLTVGDLRSRGSIRWRKKWWGVCRLSLRAIETLAVSSVAADRREAGGLVFGFSTGFIFGISAAGYDRTVPRIATFTIFDYLTLALAIPAEARSPCLGARDKRFDQRRSPRHGGRQIEFERSFNIAWPSFGQEAPALLKVPSCHSR